MTKYTPFFALMLFFTACCPEPEDISSNPVHFDNLAVGQKSRYLLLSGDDYYLQDSFNFDYLDDTLTLEIVDLNNEGFKVKETMQYTGDTHAYLQGEKDSVYYYYFNVVNDTLRITKSGSLWVNSRIFGYNSAQNGLPLIDYTDHPVEIKGWKTSFPYCECFNSGYTEHYEQFGIHYDRLNVWLQNSPMSFDGSGSTFLYSNTHGIVRMSTYSWWSQSGFGWDLLP